MAQPPLSARFDSLPKAELHLHLEGAIQPATAQTLMARHGVKATEQEVLQHYAFRDFPGFLGTFKWVSSFLREPKDYALVARALAEHLLGQNVVYAEVTLSAGGMLLRRQQAGANFQAPVCGTQPVENRRPRLPWGVYSVCEIGAEGAVG